MTRHRHRVQAEAYGVTVELVVEHSDTATPEELHRALTLAVNEAKALHQETP